MGQAHTPGQPPYADIPFEQRPLGLLTPHPKRVPHFCNDMTAQVHVGGGAIMTIVNPVNDPHVEWCLRYGNAELVRFTAASLLDSYDYLLSGNVNMKEAVRRLRLLRSARAALSAARATGGTE